ncbi:hypothetical protein HOP51_05050 [Halomonas sp. MCCC 1A11036]|uniref:Uncharacterized protein n=1 Tax=Billgrantia zhangzhouensis TaxID=2733481 RepID=A0ABS9AC39_9GAMM|nr:hypothetical protein [Halomonas zhangzhouensis]MCE8019491.1 hypothetical protein [Halomonas zhangzhouensis]
MLVRSWLSRERLFSLEYERPVRQAIELENEDVIDALEEEAEGELRQVMHALERIEEGEGELCEP